MLSDMMVLKEAYKGKRKELLEIEKHLQVIVDIANKFDYQTVVNKLPEVAKMEKLFIKCFGFSNCSLNFYHAGPSVLGVTKMINAYTLATVFKKLDMDEFTKSGKNLLRGVSAEAKHIRASINVCLDLIVYNKLTAAEVLAVMLHELGHDLDASIYYNINQAATIVNIVMNQKADIIGKLIVLYIQIDPGSGEALTRFNAMLENFITEYFPWLNILSKLGAVIERSRNAIVAFHAIITGEFKLRPDLVSSVLTHWATVVPVSGYQMEKTADSFAAMNGYGAEMASALNKLDRGENFPLSKFFDLVPVVGTNLRHMFELQVHIVNGLYDVHPQHITRAASILKTLKKEMNNPNLSPGMKKDLAKDIKEVEGVIANMTEITKDDNHKRVVLAIYNKFVFKVLKGYSDPRDLLPMASF